MAEGQKPRATYSDVVAAPRHVIAQIVNGVLHTHSRGNAHVLAASALSHTLGSELRRLGGGRREWVLLPAVEVHLGEGPDVIVPDLAAWKPDRAPPLVWEPSYVTVSPDWICEILSPETQALARKHKLDVYAREKVGHAWLVDPLAQLLEVFRLEGGNWLRTQSFTGDSLVRAEPFDAIELELGLLWAD